MTKLPARKVHHRPYCVPLKPSLHKIPVVHIIAPPVPPLVRGKQEVFVPEIYDHRICRSPVFAFARQIGNGRIPIVDIYGIAIGLLLGMVGVPANADRSACGILF